MESAAAETMKSESRLKLAIISKIKFAFGNEKLKLNTKNEASETNIVVKYSKNPNDITLIS